MMNQEDPLQWILDLISKNNLHVFYTSSIWLKIRQEVLNEYKTECQHCKARGYYKKADTVHHVQFIKKHPELALSKYYIYNSKEYRNLIPLCHDCHEQVHDYRKRKVIEQLTPERW